MRVTCLTLGCAALASTAAGCGGSGKLSPEKLAAQTKPSVVKITGKKNGGTDGGSGFVIDEKKGLVVTAAHVVAALQAIKAQVGDSTAQTSARVVGTAPCDDIAVLQLVDKPPNLKALKLGDSAKVKTGAQITVFGFPASVQQNTPTGESTGQASTVVANTGSVSAANIQSAPGGELPRFTQAIQHQAPTNPGDSGGPIVNDKGQVIAVTSLGSTGGLQNANYAIAINKVKTLLPTLDSGKSIGNVGWDLVPIESVRDHMPDIFEQDPNWNNRSVGEYATAYLKQPPVTTGLYVEGVTTGSAANKAKISYGDMIDKLEGTEVKAFQDVCDIVQSHSPGDKITVHGIFVNSADKKLTDAKSGAAIGEGWHVPVALK
jgi:S1-C subfamily serine protease